MLEDDPAPEAPCATHPDTQASQLVPVTNQARNEAPYGGEHHANHLHLSSTIPSGAHAHGNLDGAHLAAGTVNDGVSNQDAQVIAGYQSA